MSFEPHLRGLYDRHGELTASLVVDEARPKNAPLHPFFEWDDKAAAEEFRLTQARAMIRRVTFVVASQGEGLEDRKVREFRVVTDTKTGSPRPVYRRVSDFSAEEQVEVRERMKRAIASLVATYREYDEFWEAIRELAA